MRAVYSLIVTLMLASVYMYVNAKSSVFLVHPLSITAVDGTTVEFICTVNNTEEISYRVNGTAAAIARVIGKGFQQLHVEELSNMVLRRNLTVAVSSQYNNTEILCRAIGTDVNVNSETANLTVQGPLSSVGDLSYCYIDSSTVNISWSPPFTLPGTAIIGYNISVTSNGATTNNFTSDSYYVLQLSDITDSPCNEINITVSGYNGLNGETDLISVPCIPAVSLSVDIMKKLQIAVKIYVTSICIPTTVDITLFRDDTVVYSMDVMLPVCSLTDILTTILTYIVKEDTDYKLEVSFNGDFNVISRHTIFNTFGVKSVDLIDTDVDSVFCRCVFNSFSTDTGCTIQLLLSEVIWHEQNFSRSGSTATGSISGVATGLYQVNVFDQGNPTVVLTSELMVSATTTIPTISVTSNTQSSATLQVFIGVLLVLLALVPILLVFVYVLVVWQRKYHKKDRKRNEIVSKDIADLYSRPNKQPVTVEPVVYADLSEIKKKHRPPPTKTSVSRVVYSDVLIKKQAPLSSHELKRVSNMQASVTVIPVGTNVDESEFNKEIVELRFHHMDNYQEAVESRTTNDNPPSPEGRALSPPNEGDDQPPPTPDRHLSDVVQNNQCSADKEEDVEHELRSTDMENNQEAATNNYPPSPKERVASPLNEGDDQPSPIPDCHDVDQNNHHAEKEKVEHELRSTDMEEADYVTAH